MAWCAACSGTGRISCGACWGGQTHPVCPDCLGKGFIHDDQKQDQKCQRCHGAGRITPQSCPFCGNSHACPECGNDARCQ